MTKRRKNPHAVALGRRGGQVTTEKKTAAVRENGKRGGRPRKLERPYPEFIYTTVDGVKRLLFDVANIDKQSADMIADCREHLAMCRAEGITHDEGVIYEAWAIQKIAGLQVMQFDLILKVDALARRLEEHINGTAVSRD